jgi:hypothetical protein
MLAPMGLVSRRGEEEEEDELGEIRITGFGDLDAATTPQPVGLDMTTWGEGGRTALDERFHLLQAPHAWNGPILLVEEGDLLWIGRIIEQVEDERTLPLDADAEKMAYDLEGWDDENLSLLVHGLQDRKVPFAIEEGELVVHEADEAQVDGLVDEILEPTGTDTREDARAELLGDLFVAVDKLAHHPDDADARDQLEQLAREVAEHAPPYGVEQGWWASLDERARALGDELRDTADDEHEGAREAATALRDALRSYV